MPTTIVMPQLGESVAEGVIGKWLKNEGDRIERDEPIVEVITDKVNAEIPSPVTGVLQKITQPEGATVAVGQEIAIIGDEGSVGEAPADAGATGEPTQEMPGGDNGLGSAGTAVATAAPPEAQPATAAGFLPDAQVHSGNGAARGDRVRSSPLVRRLAEQSGIDLAAVPGTGIGGRVSKQDILSFIERREVVAAPAPTPPVAQPAVATAAPPRSTPAPLPAREPSANEEIVPLTPVRKIIAERMTLSKTTIPHATTIVEVDMTNVFRYREAKKDEFRRQEGVALSYVAFVIKATVEALKQYPDLNAEWGGDHILRKRDININIAVDAPEGLTTPVIHHADERSLAGLSKAINDLALRARNKKLKIEDMQGGTFTVNNTGALGSVWSISIINYPQGGMLAAAAIVKRPVVVEQDGQDLIAIRHMMNVSFSFDHRLVDGGYAAGFLTAVKTKLENWPADYPIY
jgi:2-oxoglutarate dehydrogenase dihydrolipoamide succinyltransferase (E2 component)